jgi:sortase A
VETARGDEMRLRNLVLLLVALTVMALAACSSSGQSSDEGGKVQAGKDASGEQAQKPPGKATEGKKEPPKMSKEAKARQVAPKKGKAQGQRKVSNALDHAAVHLRDTGFPWQRTANVYIAGHRIGFPGTDSNLAFYDLEDLEKGDKVYLEDAKGREYTYQVFRKLVVEPANLSVLRPVKGKNIVSLQTCTLPDYTNRVIYRAVLKDVKS